jgi:hypothetical protein
MSAHYNYELPSRVRGIQYRVRGAGPPAPYCNRYCYCSTTGYRVQYPVVLQYRVLYNRENSLSIELKINESTTLK